MSKEGERMTFPKTINQTFHFLQTKGEIYTVIGGRVAPHLEAEIAQLEHFIFLLSIVLIASALILLIIYVWNQRLKKEISIQTRKLRLLNEHLEEQKKKIADSNAFKDQILNSIDTGIVTFNVHFLPTSCNARAVDMLDLSGNIPIKIQYSSLLKKLLKHFNTEKNNQKHPEVPLIFDTYENGQRKVISYRILSMYDSQGKQTGYLLSMNDETEKKKLEQKLVTQEKLHALGQLVAGVAHEIRNPLTSIKTFVDMLPKKYDHPQFREMMIEHLPIEVNRLNMIVCDLVDFARPRPPDKKMYSAKELAKFLSFHQVMIEKKQIMLEQTIDESLVFYIDIQQIRQVLLNIILNAISAVEGMSEKKIKISIEKEDENTGRIIVTDTGKGIAKEQLNRIFEPFYTSKEKGVGLGLTLSYKLIKENNGDIQVTSKPNHGTTFMVTLPLAKEVNKNETACVNH
jgi:signal transduction histidine kinase